MRYGHCGIVYLTSPHYAIVMPLLNSKSNISCCLRGTDYFGYLRWDGRHPLYASLGDIPRHARLKEGMTVETSGFSAVFPAGLFVGKVTKVENSEDGLSYKLQVNFEYGLCPVKGRVCAYDAQSGGDRQFAAKDRIRKIRPMYDAEFFQ